jgi:ankyrin repeat protein
MSHYRYWKAWSGYSTLTPKSHVFSAWVWLYDVNQGWRTPFMEELSEHPSKHKARPLYYSASCGLRSLTERLVALQPNDVNPREGSTSIWAPLSVAINKRHLDVARLLLEHGACADIRINGDWTLLHHASYRRDIDVMQLLLEHGADVGCGDNLDLTPLHLASEVGCPKAMQLLLEHGANVNECMRYSWPPLYRAVLSRNVEAVRILLQYGADINDKAEYGSTALRCASNGFTGSLEIVRVLLPVIRKKGKKLG